MKNFINFYYNLNINEIHFSSSKYLFSSGNDRYLFKICDNFNLETYYKSLEVQIRRYKYFFLIIPNRDGKIVTVIDNKPYVLLKITNIVDDSISFFDIRTDMYVYDLNYFNLINHFPWVNIWENKIDYLESWILAKKERYKSLYPLFNYFIGISENALSYLKETEKNEKMEVCDRLTIQHNRIGVATSLYDYYDPTSIIIDHSSRDVSEFVKSCFVNGTFDINMLGEYLKTHKFSRYWLRIMYSRILFPSFFFDNMEKMITNDSTENLFYLESKIVDFEKFLRDIGKLLNEEYNIPLIPWTMKQYISNKKT